MPVSPTGPLRWSHAHWHVRCISHDHGARQATTFLPSPVAPGGSITLQATVAAPAAAGAYTLQWDMIREGVTWFSQQGVVTGSVTINVTP